MSLNHHYVDSMHRVELRPDPLAARRLRRVLESLDYPLEEVVTEELNLVATELVTNAVRHSQARERNEDLVVFVRVGPPTLLIKVCDPGPGLTGIPLPPAPLAEGGRGLLLVEAVAKSWGTSRIDIGGAPWSCVWACFGEDALPSC